MSEAFTIYDNYDLFNDKSIGNARECFVENGYALEEITEQMVFDQIYEDDNIIWNEVKAEMENFFSDKYYCVLVGKVGRWNGVYDAGTVFRGEDISSIIYKALKDCDYVKFTDRGGHFYIDGDHHDGHVSYEIKVLNERGITYYENWGSRWNDKRSEAYVIKKLMDRNFSVLPRFAEKVYGYGIKKET